MTNTGEAEKFAAELLAAATDFDHADVDNPTDDPTIRTEVLKRFVEQYLERKISDDDAEQINQLTQHPGDCETYHLAPILSELLNLN